jgi:hypothetical protein
MTTAKPTSSVPTNKSRICFFGGEKGGIGKTTLAILFAYLFWEAKREISGVTLDYSNPAFKRQLTGILPSSSVGAFSLVRNKDISKLGSFLSENRSKIILIDSPSSFYYLFENYILDFLCAVDRLDFFWIVSEESNSFKQLFAYQQILADHPNINYWVFFPDWIHGGEFDSNFEGLPCYRFPTISPFILNKLKDDLQFLKFKELGDPYLKGIIESYLIRFKNQLGEKLNSFLMG